MNESNGYAVFFFPQALDALGAAIRPYLQDGPMGPHVHCNEIDTGGALLEMKIQGLTAEGKTVLLELMVPSAMVRMVVSSQSDAVFGFGPRMPEMPVTTLPPVGPTAEPAQARPEALPGSSGSARADDAPPAAAHPSATAEPAALKPPRRE